MISPDYVLKYWLQFAAAAITVTFLGAAIYIWQTLPPRTILMATGVEGGAHHQMGKQYREILAQSGVKVKLLTTAGGIENLVKLRDPHSGVDVGFIQGGTTTQTESPNLASLGTVFYEPLWFFYRTELGGPQEALIGRPFSIGPEGSGGSALALELIKRLRIEAIVGELLAYPPSVTADKLIAGEIGGAFMVTSWDSPTVQRLIHADGVELTNYPRADAYVALYPFLNKLVLPAGVADLLGNRPPQDIVLLAPKASLAVRKELHPAIQALLLNAAAQIHSPPGIFQKAGQFPAAESNDLTLSEEARHFYKTGRPFLQNYLPFWAATLVEQAVLVLVPLAAVFYPLFKLIPQLYDWIMQLRIRGLYKEMRSIEREWGNGRGQDPAAISLKLDHLDQRANRLRLPSAYSSNLYTLRDHIGLVRAQLPPGSAARIA